MRPEQTEPNMTKSSIFGVQTLFEDEYRTSPIDPSDSAAMQGATAPAMFGATPMVQELYLTEIGDPTAIDQNDIHQGQMGDCFLLSSIGEIALLRPSFISSMIHSNSNGTETVTLYKASNGSMPNFSTTAYKAVTVTVSNSFVSYSVDNGATQDVVNGHKEIWPQVLESAFAAAGGGIGSIANGGNPALAMEELTGMAASYIAPAKLTLAALQSYVAANDMLVFDTASSGALSNGLFNNHAYMFDSVSGTGAAATVKLSNPWGYDQPTPVLLSTLSRSFVEIDIGHLRTT